MTEAIRKQSSMNYWFPKLKNSGVQVPETRALRLREWDEATEFQEGIPMRLVDFHDLKTAITELGGTPAFIRTDQASDKHGMVESSKVASLDTDDLEDYVFNLLRFNELAGFAGLPYTSLYAREWLDLKHEFTAFDHTPIASEVRFFVRDGEVHDYGFYWPADAIEQHRGVHNNGDIRGDWKTLLSQVKSHALAEAEDTLYGLAEQVATEFGGYWSVDFAETESGDWYAIDMARGEASWHPESCVKPEVVQ